MATLRTAGAVRVPGDKSISHRALILAALADGDSRVQGVLDAADVRSTAEVLRAAGADIPDISPSMRIRGRGLRGLTHPRAHLDCGNSGTTTRLMAGVLAAYPFSSTLTGDESLSVRPMRRVAEPLTYMGARVEFAHGEGLPMTVHGTDLRSIDWDTGGSSAQVKSAILLAAMVSQVEVRVTEKRPSRDHTERMLRAMDIDVENDGNQVCLRPSSTLKAVDVSVPGDPSSAAFFVALATLGAAGTLELPNVCLNPTRTGFIEVIKRMGGAVSEQDVHTVGGEDVGTLIVAPGDLRDIEVGEADVTAMIDELPLLACVAAGAGIELQITGAQELRVKESDRIRVVCENLRALGADVEELPDGLRLTAGKRVLKGSVDARGDHRIAMAFGVLSTVPGNSIEINGRRTVDISYPGFWDDLARVAS